MPIRPPKDGEIDIHEHKRWVERNSYKGPRGEGNNIYHRLYHGEPIPLHWNGWHTTSHELSRQGWEIVGEEHCDQMLGRHAIRVGCVSPDKRAMLSGISYFHISQLYAERYGTATYQNNEDWWYRRGFEMQQYSFRDTFSTVSPIDFSSLNGLRPIDIHSATDIRSNDLSYKTLKVFQYLDEKTPEFFIKPGSVDECLNMILKIQHPEQEALKKSLILPDKKPIIQAKIFSLAS